MCNGIYTAREKITAAPSGKWYDTNEEMNKIIGRAGRQIVLYRSNWRTGSMKKTGEGCHTQIKTVVCLCNLGILFIP